MRGHEFDDYSGNYETLLKDPIRDGFAADSQFFAERKWDLIRDFFKNIGQDTRDLRWLDVGCGKGELLRLGAPHFESVVGCDPSWEMMQACGELDVRHQPDAMRLPFGDESFDFVTAVCVYHHVAPLDRPTLTREVARVLRPGGVFSIIEHNPYNPATRLIVSRTPVDQNAILLRPSESSAGMTAAGFGIVKTSFFLYLPAKLYRAMPRFERMLERVPAGGQYAVFARKPTC